MKHLLYILLLFLSMKAATQVIGISIDTVLVHTGPTADGIDLTGYTTYRVYAVCATESTVIKSVWGNSDNPLVITTTGHFYNQLNGTYLATGISQAMLDNIPSIHFDSWITLDFEQSQGMLYQLYYLTGAPGYNFQNLSLDSESGPSFVCNSAIGEIWSASSASPAGSDLKILVAQLTTDGELGVQMNFQVSLDGSCGSGSENITLSAGNPQIGCSDAVACNYDPMYDPANVQVCTYPGCTEVFACNYDPQAGCDDGSCQTINGCMHPQACNYDPLATCSGDCIMPTCNDPLACNYEPSTCDGGNCQYDNRNLRFFRDLNINGVRDSNEPLINGLGISMDFNGHLFYINSHSFSTFLVMEPIPVDVSILNYNTDYVLTTPANFQMMPCESTYVGFNLVEPFGTLVNASVGSLNCTTNNNGQIFISNQNQIPVNIQVTLDHSNELNYISSDNGGIAAPGNISWTLNNLQSYNDMTLHFSLTPPDASFIGDMFQYTITVQVTDLSGNLLDTYTSTQDRLFFCGYDPNNKISDLSGYRDEHFVLESDVIPYTINFQNTGNAPANNIIIADTLDTSMYDLSTFEVIGASHEMFTVVEENGSIRFVFENINLPDSTSDSEGSMGYVMYNIQPLAGSAPFTQLINEADIYFDSNPPIHTNSTLHTIFDCDLLEINLSDSIICEGNSLVIDGFNDYVEDYNWIIDGSMNSTTPELNYMGELGNHLIELNTSNPLCSQDLSFEITIAPSPEIIVYWQGQGDIFALGGVDYEWHYFGWDVNPVEMISDINNDTISIVDLDYPYAVFVIGTDANGCQDTSNTEIIWNIDEKKISKIDIWPNPFHDNIYFNLPSGNWQMTCYDATGRWMIAKKNLIGKSTVTMENIPSGLYTITFMNEKGDLLKGTIIRE